MADLQDQPPASSRRSDIIFDSKIEILTLKKLSRKSPLYLYLAGPKDQPPASSRWKDIIFYMKIAILTLKNFYLDIYECI